MDDTLILVNGDLGVASVVRNSLIWFVACPGLKVNTNKTVLFQINTVKDWE